MPTGDEAAGSAGARVLEWVSLVVTPFATLTGLLYYFGWVRTNATFGYFGIDPNLPAFSPQDYLLRSAGVAFRPCALLLAGAAAALLAHRLLGRVCGPTVEHGRIVLVDVAVGGLAATAFGAAVLLGRVRTDAPVRAAVALVAGAVVLELAATHWPLAADRAPERVLRRVTVAGVVVLGLFWGFAVHAQQSGERVAAALAGNPAALPDAVVLSKEDLGISGFGVTATKLPGTVALPYRYTGLRLFVYRNGRWFLLPAGWSRDNGATTVVLPDTASVRVELHP